MSIQITSGRFGRRQLIVPKGDHIRPTTGQLRAAVCNILAGELEGANVLDLFAGSGAMGFEMLSQGASHVDFVESHSLSIASLRSNQKQLNVEAETTLYAEDVFQFLSKALLLGKRYRILFADPPYLKPGMHTISAVARLLHFLDKHPQLIDPEGVVLFEQAKRDCTALESTCWHCVDRRVYGDTTLLFWKLKEPRTGLESHQALNRL